MLYDDQRSKTRSTPFVCSEPYLVRVCITQGPGLISGTKYKHKVRAGDVETLVLVGINWHVEDSATCRGWRVAFPCLMEGSQIYAVVMILVFPLFRIVQLPSRWIFSSITLL
jgi:hypothetical protein